MEAFAGKWNNVSSEGFDTYLKEIGVGMMTRTVASKLKPVLTFVVEGDTVKMTSTSTFKTHVTDFTLGKEFEDTTIDGRTVTSVFNLEDGKLVQIEKGKEGGKDSRIERFIQDGKLVITCDCNGVKCTRVYEKAV